MAYDFEINLVAGRDTDFTGTLEDANGNAIAITAGSDVLFKVYSGGGATPILDLSKVALAGGSVTSFTAGSGAGKGGYTAKFFAADTSGLTPGTYDVEVDLVDAGDSNRIKNAANGVMNIIGQPLGNTT